MSSWLRPRRILLALGLLLVVGVLTFAYQAWRAGSALLDARTQAQHLQAQLVAGQLRDAESSAAKLRRATKSANDHTGGLLWSVGAHLPLLGDSIGAVRTSADALDTIARHSLPAFLDLAEAVDDGRLKPKHGRIDVAQVRRFTPAVRRAADAVDPAAEAMERAAAGRLLFPVSTLVENLREKVGGARNAIDTAADAFEVLPTMLGADGPRRYLLLIQNNAEIRSTGGMPGSWALLYANHGRLRMGKQGTAATLGVPSSPPVPLTHTEKALYGEDFGTDLRDLTFTPDFPRAAELAAALVQDRTGVRVDGVFSVDPVALGQVLEGTGPVTVTKGAVLTSANAATTLLNTTYRLLSTQQQQDDFNEAAARKVFDAMVNGQGNELTMVHGLVTAASQGRVLAWSRHPSVATVIQNGDVAGALPGNTGHTPQVGVYLDDAAASKMEFYLRQYHVLTAERCHDGVQDLSLSTTLRSTAPRNVTRLSSWVTGFGTVVPRGVMYLNVWVYAPAGGEFTSMSVDGRHLSPGGGVQKGRKIAVVSVKIPPGASRTIEVGMRTGPGQTGSPVLTTTPGMEFVPNPVTVPSACD